MALSLISEHYNKAWLSNAYKFDALKAHCQKILYTDYR